MKATLLSGNEVVIRDGKVVLSDRGDPALWRGEFLSPEVDVLKVGEVYRLLFDGGAFLNVVISELRKNGRALFQIASESKKPKPN